MIMALALLRGTSASLYFIFFEKLNIKPLEARCLLGGTFETPNNAIGQTYNTSEKDALIKCPI